MTWLTFIRKMFSGKKAAEKVVVHDPASQQPMIWTIHFSTGMFRRELGRPSQKLCRKSDLISCCLQVAVPYLARSR
jgi:hypothetical protein